MQLTEFPGTARDDAAAFSFGPHAYFGTGMEVGWGLTNDWWMYDFNNSNNPWSYVPSLPASPRQYCSTFDGVGDGYLFGGLDSTGPLNEMWLYSESTDSWVQRASLPGSGRYACATFTAWDIMFVVGGMLAGGAPTNECWSYDRSTDTWMQVAPMPGASRHRASAFGSPGAGYVVGGADSAFNALADAWMYDPMNDQWQAIAPLPEGRYGADAVQTDWRPILVGGVSNDSTYHANAFEYDPVLDTWTDLGNVLPTGIRGGAICFTGGGAWMIVYGLGLDSSLTRHRELYYSGYFFGLAEQTDIRIQAFPDPGTDSFSLLGLGPEQAIINISDAQGRLIRTSKETTIDASTFTRGVHLVSVRISDGRTYHTRWIKL